MIRRPPRSTQSRSSAASDVYKRQVLLSSHALAEVEAVCERLAMIQAGRMLVHAPTRDLLAHAPRRLSVRYRRPPSSVPDGLNEVHVDGNQLKALLPAG